MMRENLMAQGFLGPETSAPKPSKPQKNLGDNAKKSLLERVKGAWIALKTAGETSFSSSTEDP